MNRGRLFTPRNFGLAQQPLIWRMPARPFQHMSGAGVPQRVRRDVVAEAGAVSSFGDDAHNVVVTVTL